MQVPIDYFYIYRAYFLTWHENGLYRMERFWQKQNRRCAAEVYGNGRESDQWRHNYLLL